MNNSDFMIRVAEKLKTYDDLVLRAHKMRKVCLIGSQHEAVNSVEEILRTNQICECETVSDDWKEGIIWAQEKIQAREYDGLIIAEPYCITGFEQKIYIDPDKISVVPYLFFQKNGHTDIDILKIFSPMLTGGRIGEIQFNLTDKCNLNCNLCSHFCPLVKEVQEYSADEFLRDATRVKELTEHVDVVGLWGGRGSFKQRN